MADLKDRKGGEILFRGFEDIDLEKLWMILDETYDKETTFRIQLKKLINSRWYDMFDYRYSEKPGNKLVAFYSDFYFREDHIKIFTDFIKEFPYIDYVVPVKLPRKRRNYRRGFEMLRWDLHSLWLLKNVRAAFRKRLYWIRILGLARLYCIKMNQYLNNKNYSYGLVYSDSNPYENMLVQIMKKKLHTATLQHGIFDRNGYWKGLEFRASVADDWLAWNQYSKELAMECGISEDNIKVLGMPRYINPVKLEDRADTGVFSVILGGKVLFKENRKLVEIANLLAKEMRIKYYLRYHPTCKGDEYSDIIDEQLIAKGHEGETIRQMCECSDFSLVGSGTSMMIDLIYLRYPFFQYYEKWDGKRMKGRENYFSSFESLKKQIKAKAISQNDEMFQYYCTTIDVKGSYHKYFNSI